MDPRRAALAAFGLALAAIAAYVALQFVAALTVAVFVYYSTRPVYRGLGRVSFWRFGMPKRVRAALAITFFSLPLVLLLGYTLVLLLSELRLFVEEYPLMETIGDALEAAADLEELPELTPGGLLEAYRAGELDGAAALLTENLALLANMLTTFLLSTLIVLVTTYYLLIDGHKIREYLLKFDDDGVLKQYFEVADRELSKVLFGNTLTIIIIAAISVVVYSGYNALSPQAANVPFPALAGALTGVASLIPVVGMKAVYVPLAAAVAVNAGVQGEFALLGYVAAFLLVTAIFVDTIPDLVLRPYLSGDHTHVGLLMLAYIFGTVVFGFYGLFLAPIVLVLGLTFIYVVLPYVAGEDVPAGLHRPDSELTLEDFVEPPEDELEELSEGGRFSGFFSIR